MGKHAGWTENLEGFQRPFHTSPQAHPYPQESNSSDHRYGESANHTQDTEAQVKTVDALQALACAAMEDKEAMANLTSINLTLSKILTQAQETILVLSKQLQALQVHTKKTQPQRGQH